MSFLTPSQIITWKLIGLMDAASALKLSLEALFKQASKDFY